MAVDEEIERACQRGIDDNSVRSKEVEHCPEVIKVLFKQTECH